VAIPDDPYEVASRFIDVSTFSTDINWLALSQVKEHGVNERNLLDTSAVSHLVEMIMMVTEVSHSHARRKEKRKKLGVS